jgi:hypothetical protein
MVSSEVNSRMRRKDSNFRMARVCHRTRGLRYRRWSPPSLARFSAPLFPVLRNQPRHIVFREAHVFHVTPVLGHQGVDPAGVQQQTQSLRDDIRLCYAFNARLFRQRLVQVIAKGYGSSGVDLVLSSV